MTEMGKRRRKYTDVAVAESQMNELTEEEFPDGAYGAPTNFPLGHDWKPNQYFSQTRFTYETRQMHEGLRRQDPGSHPTHDDPHRNEEPL